MSKKSGGTSDFRKLGSTRASNVIDTIQHLELRLAETLAHLENAATSHTEKSRHTSRHVDTVTSCVIRVCTTLSTITPSQAEFELEFDDIESLKAPKSFYRHPFPEGFRLQSIVPRSRMDWLQFLVWLVKQRLIIKFLTDAKLKRVIEIARGQIGRLRPYKVCPDIPECYYWTETQVADWVADVGFPELSHAFLENCINGRRLVIVDASALNKMGIQNWSVIQKMARNIRCLFGLPRPNAMRPLSVEQPFETFLTKYRLHNGRTYDLLTFKEYCKRNGHNYETVIEMQLKDAYTCAFPERGGIVIDAPSVEFQVRHQFIRSQTLENLINEIIQLVFVPRDTGVTRAGGTDYVDRLIDRILNEALLELGFGDPKLYTGQRVKFAAEIALALLAEMKHTSEIMSDIAELKKHLRADVTEQEINDMKAASGAFMEDLAPIAALLALNQLSLEGIFKEEPDFQQFVDEIAADAERLTNDAAPLAEAVVNQTLEEAQVVFLAHREYPSRSIGMIREGTEAAKEILEELITQTVAVGRRTGDSNLEYDGPQDQGDHVVFPVTVSLDQTLRDLRCQVDPLNFKTNNTISKMSAGLIEKSAFPPTQMKLEHPKPILRRTRSAPVLTALGFPSLPEPPEVKAKRPESKKRSKVTRTRAKDIWKEVKGMETFTSEILSHENCTQLKRSFSLN